LTSMSSVVGVYSGVNTGRGFVREGIELFMRE